MKTPANSWPVVPTAARPKSLYLAEVLPEEEEQLLTDRGWTLVDVRLLPGKTLPERQTRTLAWFEGLLSGSIGKELANLAVLEMEAKACGLTTIKELPKEKEEGLAEQTIDEILGEVNSRRGKLKKLGKAQEKAEA